MQPLPPELVSLVHHVQLNRSGWWDVALERLILAALWLEGAPVAADAVGLAIREHFGVQVDPQALAARMDRLRGASMLLAVNGKLKVADARLAEFEQDRAESDRLLDATRARFVAALGAAGASVDGASAWDTFGERWLNPTICTAGARTYELVSGSYDDWTASTSLEAFLAEFPTDQHGMLRHAVAQFLDPRDATVRTFLLRLMDAYFVVEASRLSQSTVNALGAMTGQCPTFALLLDTNFLFSVLGLHGEETREAASALLGLARDLNGRVNVRLYALPATIDETRAALDRELASLRGLRLPRGLAQAAQLTGDLGEVATAYAEAAAKSTRTLTPEEFLRPYIQDLVAVLRGKGVELFNTPLETVVGHRQVKEDIDAEVEREQERRVGRAKSRAQVTHDVALWHVARAKRPPRVDSPTEAGFWVVTEDYRLITFDAIKRRAEGNADAIPVALQPMAFVQILQFWTGRTEAVEEALLGGLRLSLLSSDFDPEAERTTISILESLSRYENVGDLPSEAVAHVLVNDALRQKIARTTDETERAELVREELFAEHRRATEKLAAAEAERAALARQAAEATAGRGAAEAQADLLAGRLQAAATEIARRDALAAEQARQLAAASDVEAARDARERQMEAEVAELRRRVEREEHARVRAREAEELAARESLKRRARRGARVRYVAGALVAPPALAAAAVLGAARLHLAPWLGDWRATAPLFVALALAWLWAATWYGRRVPDVVVWGLYRFVAGLPGKLMVPITALGYGVLGNAATDVWWKPLADRSAKSSTAAVAAASKPVARGGPATEARGGEVELSRKSAAHQRPRRADTRATDSAAGGRARQRREAGGR